MRVLGIETSCDETAAAVVEGKNPPTPLYTKGAVKVLSSVVSSQIEIHKKYGGVVPEVAAREHVLNILPVINEALEKAGISIMSLREARHGRRSNLGKTHYSRLPRFAEAASLAMTVGIDAIAVTTGPGLITSLQVGVETAKVLSYVWKIPAISVNHIEGHIYANWLLPISEVKSQKSKVKSNIVFPALILTVSGGHTMLVLMNGHGKYKIIGETVDDAAGEAFDKAAAMMGIGYPGGPIISAMAAQFKKSPQPLASHSPASHFRQGGHRRSGPLHKGGEKISLPRPMINSKDYNFSFSGLKTALLYKIQKDPTSPFNNKGLRGASPEWKKIIPEYCFEFQQAAIDVLIHKTIKAAEKLNAKTIMLSGGVAANLELRKQMKENVECRMSNVEFLIPDLKYTTDNAAMIATAGYFKALRKKFTPPLRKQSEASWQKLKADCNLEF
jgi:N6-L-threonylcarbamoyladenine synthase